MKILSIDTASDVCGVSILENTNLIYNKDLSTGRTHSENLMPMVEQAFLQSNLQLKDIGLLVCDIGPGSFTGIRIGIATIKAFHDSLSIPCIGISSLEALAYSIQEDGYIVSILDCKNDNCYFALYELKNYKYTELISPTSSSVLEALSICKNSISSTSCNITFIGDGSKIYKELIVSEFKNCHLADDKYNFLNSYFVGIAGLNKFKENKFYDVLPLYLKKPQAQRQLIEKTKGIEILPMTQNDLHIIEHSLVSDFDDFWTYNVLKEELQSEKSKYFVAKLDGQIVGFCGIKIMLDEADIMNIVVKKDFRNQGIGSILLQNLINLSKKLDVSSLTLEVMEENFPAIHLYKNFGFKQIGLRKNYYKDKNGLIMQYGK